MDDTSGQESAGQSQSQAQPRSGRGRRPRRSAPKEYPQQNAPAMPNPASTEAEQRDPLIARIAREENDDTSPALFPDAGGTAARLESPAWRRYHARKTIREFLQFVPRSDPNAAVSFLRPDGTPRTLTRADLTTAIDRLRPRQRQIVRLAIEERWPRHQVCAYLQHISIKTFERDYAEALELLIQL